MEEVFIFDEKSEIIFKPTVDFVEKMMYYGGAFRKSSIEFFRRGIPLLFLLRKRIFARLSRRKP